MNKFDIITMLATSSMFLESNLLKDKKEIKPDLPLEKLNSLKERQRLKQSKQANNLLKSKLKKIKKYINKISEGC